MSARENIEVNLKISFEGTDRNGYTYTEDALKNAVEEFNQSNSTIPLLFMTESGERVPVGTVTSLAVEGLTLEVAACIPAGGTIESVPGEKDGGREGSLIKKMSLAAISLVKDPIISKEARAIISEFEMPKPKEEDNGSET